MNETQKLTKDNENVQYGWVCPKCGMVHSPSDKTCQCSNHITYNVNMTDEHTSTTLGKHDHMICD